MLLDRRPLAISYERKESDIIQGISNKYRRDKGLNFMLPLGSAGRGKAEKPKFYNDEENHIEHLSMPLKPRQRPPRESEKEYKQRVTE